jgi:acyl carrier protein
LTKLQELVENTVCDELSIPRGSVQANTAFESIDCDSLELINIIQVCEAARRVKVPNGRLASIKTVGDLVYEIQWGEEQN